MPSFVQVVLSFIFVLSLIGIFSFLMKRYTIEKNIFKGGHKRRMKVEEILYLDSRRKLVIVSQDDKEFTLILSPNGETVVASSSPHPQTEKAALPLPVKKKKKLKS